MGTFVLFAGMALIWKVTADEAPQGQEVRLQLSEHQRTARSVRLAYMQEGDEITNVFVRYPEGVPATVSHTPTLAPGVYDLAVELGYLDGHVEHVAKTLTVPSEEAIRIRLHAP